MCCEQAVCTLTAIICEGLFAHAVTARPPPPCRDALESDDDDGGWEHVVAPPGGEGMRVYNNWGAAAWGEDDVAL